MVRIIESRSWVWAGRIVEFPQKPVELFLKLAPAGHTDCTTDDDERVYLVATSEIPDRYRETSHRDQLEVIFSSEAVFRLQSLLFTANKGTPPDTRASLQDATGWKLEHVKITFKSYGIIHTLLRFDINDDFDFNKIEASADAIANRHSDLAMSYVNLCKNLAEMNFIENSSVYNFTSPTFLNVNNYNRHGVDCSFQYEHHIITDAENCNKLLGIFKANSSLGSTIDFVDFSVYCGISVFIWKVNIGIHVRKVYPWIYCCTAVLSREAICSSATSCYISIFDGISRQDPKHGITYPTNIIRAIVTANNYMLMATEGLDLHHDENKKGLYKTISNISKTDDHVLSYIRSERVLLDAIVIYDNMASSLATNKVNMILYTIAVLSVFSVITDIFSFFTTAYTLPTSLSWRVTLYAVTATVIAFSLRHIHRTQSNHPLSHNPASAFMSASSDTAQGGDTNLFSLQSANLPRRLDGPPTAE